MSFSEIAPGIRYVGVNDRTTTRFEALWPLPAGVSYNAYLVIGERIALIDTVEQRFGGILFDNIRREIGDRPIDYLVINHMEPDHSSSIEALRLRYPGIRLVGNAKALQMVEGFYGVGAPRVEVAEGSTLDLGGLSLAFFMAPMVHWPETMVTWCPERRTLFSGDAFGTFGALNGGITDSQLDPALYWDEMRRYYASIVGKYGAPVQKALQKVRGLDLATVCSTHGPVWQEQIPQVLDLYDRMSRYEGEPGAVIAYGSMYGNTAQMAERLARHLAEAGVKKIAVHDLTYSDPSFVLRDIFRYDTLVVGSPTYNGALFPPVARLLEAVAARGIPQRNFAFFGSFCWAGCAVRSMAEFAQRMKWEPVGDAVEMKQGFSADADAACRTLAQQIAAHIGQ
ncbi:MAG: FprA family A-type flavoprotein [Alistipes sp.]|nr:FprA family A-type flavoprotein [Alistipes sp.]